MNQRFVVEVESAGNGFNDVTAEDLRLSLPLIVPWLKVNKVEAGSIQDICDEVHGLRDQIDGAA